MQWSCPQLTKSAKRFSFFALISGQTFVRVIRAGIAHFWFVTIHPFDDGNGRMARAIAEMALEREVGLTERFYNMSIRIESERRDYAVLERCTPRRFSGPIAPT